MSWLFAFLFWKKSWRCLVGGFRFGLGRRPRVHLLLAADERQHFGLVRGQAGGHAGLGAVFQVRDRLQYVTITKSCEIRSDAYLAV